MGKMIIKEQLIAVSSTAVAKPCFFKKRKKKRILMDLYTNNTL
jgi:hypothetical protein